MSSNNKQISDHKTLVTDHGSQLTVIIMAGGEGIRFYPLSTPERPKQFLNFIGDKSFIRQTFERILPLVSPERIYVATSEKYIGLVKEHLPEVPMANIIAEPLKKNTAPALAFTTALIHSQYPEAIVCCLPSDHHISDENGFREVISKAIEVASQGYLVTLGMKPTWASTEYGYICPSSVILSELEAPAKGWSASGGKDPHSAHADCFSVKQFTEKPKKELAEKYIEQGYLWNGGIFVWKSSVFLSELEKHAPNLLLVTSHESRVTDYESQVTSHKLLVTSYDYFQSAPSISIDYAVMERSDKVAVIPSDIGWSDVGNWESVDRLIQSGANVAPNVISVMTKARGFL